MVAVEYNDTNNKDSGGKYDAHYLLGNYYQFNAVTAGEAGEKLNQDIKGSICPKGWSLPIGGVDNRDASGSYNVLLQKYGLESRVGGASSYEDNGLGYNIAKAPLYFVRGGFMGMTTAESGLHYMGYSGWYLTSRMYGDSGQYNGTPAFFFNASSSYPLPLPILRSTAATVRCVAR